MATRLEQIYKDPFVIEEYFIDLRESQKQICDTWLEEYLETYPRKSATATCGTFASGFSAEKIERRKWLSSGKT